MKLKKFITLIIFILIISLMNGCGSNNSNKNNNTSNTTSNSSQKKDIKYDNLQKLYLSINSNMSYSEALEKVKKTNLPYNETIHNTIDGNKSKTIKIAFTKGATYEHHADSGDYIDISFEKCKENNTYLFNNIEYSNNKKAITIFEYKKGVYWDFRDKKDAGLYINNYKNTSGSKEEKYIKASSKEEQLKYIYNYSE
ncbi:hypothetical protein [Clostridium botulinum]|uniref:hypothetical protein n=1 Tax=Clostridium botulinum TaxID=1491 RepID=UPI0007E1415B|nr:hypothetical protein [Clostridium botulinum]KEI75865.1 hypothetical protein N486_08810 [Clostridium botulinum B2 128]KEI92011.1 hypothetical protein N491_08960 [Clostridium botulinum B2 275]